jgi:hypothetical protein
MMRLAGHVGCMEEIRNIYKIMTGKTYKENPLGRPRRRWEIIFVGF